MTVFAANRMTLDEYRRLCAAGTSPPRPHGPPHSPTPAAGRHTPGAARAPQRAGGPSTPPRRSGAAIQGDAAQGGHKYRAESCAGPDGQGGTIRYQSKKGARLARQLEDERIAGAIVAFSPEPSLIIGSLGGKPIRHRPDALAILTVEPDGSFHGRFVEAKGYDVREGRRKRLATERALGVRIQVL